MDHHPESQPAASAATMPVNAPQLPRPLSRADDTNRPSSATVGIVPRSSSPSQITPTPSNVVPPRPPPQQESILVKPTETETATQRSSTSTTPTNNPSLSESAPRSKSPSHSALSAPAPSIPGAPPPVPAKPTPRQVTISDDRATMSTTHPGAPPSSSSHMPSLSDSSLLMPPPPPAAPTRPRRTSYADVAPSSHTTTTTTVVPPRVHTPTTMTSPEVWFPVYSSPNSRPGTGVGAGANPPRRQNTSGSSYYTPHPSRANTGNNTIQPNPTFITHDETHEFGVVPAAAGIPAAAAVDDRRYSNVPGSAQPARADSERRNSSRPFSIRAPSQHDDGNNGDGNGVLDLSRSNTQSYEKVARSTSEARGPPTVSDRLKNLIKSATEERDRYAIKAKKTGYTLNVAIGIQVVLGALTTGFAAVNGSRAISLAVAGLGGTSTLVASYLARMRGSREPELSISIKKELDSFIRQVSDFDSDYGHLPGETYDKQIKGFRTRFEEIMGLEQAERKLSPPV